MSDNLGRDACARVIVLATIVVVSLFGIARAGSSELSFDKQSSVMPSGTPADSAPAGFVSFCSRNLDQCAPSENAASTVHIDDGATRHLEDVDYSINRSIHPEGDDAHYGVGEYWTLPRDGRGSCHDYALAKRAALIRDGYPERALRIAIVQTTREGRHAVLTVATDRGD